MTILIKRNAQFELEIQEEISKIQEKQWPSELEEPQNPKNKSIAWGNERRTKMVNGTLPSPSTTKNLRQTEKRDGEKEYFSPGPYI